MPTKRWHPAIFFFLHWRSIVFPVLTWTGPPSIGLASDFMIHAIALWQLALTIFSNWHCVHLPCRLITRILTRNTLLVEKKCINTIVDNRWPSWATSFEVTSQFVSIILNRRNHWSQLSKGTTIIKGQHLASFNVIYRVKLIFDFRKFGTNEE